MVDLTQYNLYPLWRQDPRLSALGKTKARAEVKQQIRKLVEALVGESPKDGIDFRGVPQLSVGYENYRTMGAYFDRTTEGIITTHRRVTAPLPEDVLLEHDQLGPLLLMQEELLPTSKPGVIPKKDPRNRITITSSPLYQAAVEKYYGGLQARSSSPPMPEAPPTLKRARRHPPLPPLSRDLTPPPYILPRAGPSRREVVEISDDEPAVVDVPLLLVFWLLDSTDYIEVLVYGKEGQKFRLGDFRDRLNERGIDLENIYEAYIGAARMWMSWGEWETVGTHLFKKSKLQTFLFREAGVKHHRGFHCFQNLTPSSSTIEASGKMGRNITIA